MKKTMNILNEGFKRLFEAEELVESRKNDEDFTAIYGEERLNKFKAQKVRMQSPNNDITYWIGMARRESVEEATRKFDELITELENTKTRSQKRKENAQGAELIFEDENWKVYHITTYEAAAQYGSHTKWCITGRYPGYRNDADGRGFFNRYLANDYTGYYFFIRKDGSDIKYCVCPKQSGGFDIWTPTDGRYTEFPGDLDLSGIPELARLPMLGSLRDEELYEPEDAEDEEEDTVEDEEPEWGEEPEDEGPTEWEDENGNIHHGHRPDSPENPELISVNNPDEFEFAANSRDDAIRQFAEHGFEGARFERELNGPMCVVHFMVEPEHQEFEQGEDEEPYVRDLPGDRYTAFVFFPGQGGGPLMTQDGKVVAFRSAEDVVNQFGGDHFNTNDIHSHRENEQEPQEQEESLNEADEGIDDEYFTDVESNGMTDEEFFWRIKSVSATGREMSEDYYDFDDVRADFLYMTQEEPENYKFVSLEEINIINGEEVSETLDTFVNEEVEIDSEDMEYIPEDEIDGIDDNYDSEVARIEYCVMKDGNNIECFDNEGEAIEWAEEENADEVLEVYYGPKDKFGDEPELGTTCIWENENKEINEIDDEF